MIVCHSQRFVFFSNPKTGSETLRRVLAGLSEEPVVMWREKSRKQPFYPHMAPYEAAAVFADRGWDFFAYRRITCVRNPYPRLVSLYRMIAEADRRWRVAAKLRIGPPGFRNWLRRSRPDGRGGGGRRHQRWRRFGAWSAESWCHDASGKMLVSDILPLEQLGAELSDVLAGLGCPSSAPLPVLNARPAVDWRAWYDDETRALVARRYAWDIENFNYS